MTCPARLCKDRLGALATTVSPVSFKPPQKDNIPLHGRRWKAIAKPTLMWKLIEGEFASNFLSCPLDSVHKIFFIFSRGLWLSSCSEDHRDVDVFQALPVTGRGSIPHISGNCREQAKHCDWSSRARADTEKQQLLDGTRPSNTWGGAPLRDVSKLTPRVKTGDGNE